MMTTAKNQNQNNNNKEKIVQAYPGFIGYEFRKDAWLSWRSFYYIYELYPFTPLGAVV